MTCKDQGIDIYRVHIAADIYNLSLRFIINDLASFSRISSSRLSFLLFSQFSLQKQIEFFSLFLSNICAADLPWKKSFFFKKREKNENYYLSIGFIFVHTKQARLFEGKTSKNRFSTQKWTNRWKIGAKNGSINEIRFGVTATEDLQTRNWFLTIFATLKLEFFSTPNETLFRRCVYSPVKVFSKKVNGKKSSNMIKKTIV